MLQPPRSQQWLRGFLFVSFLNECRQFRCRGYQLPRVLFLWSGAKRNRIARFHNSPISHHNDAVLLEFGRAYQEATSFHKLHPPIG